MSQFDFPRLHFRGQFSANVGTANNDDFGSPQFVDSAQVRVDTLGMTDDQFAKWLRTLDSRFDLPSGWNLYGNGDCQFMNSVCHAAEPAPGILALTGDVDPVINAEVRLTKAIMVDQDPEGTTSTQIFAMEFRLSGPGGMLIVGRPARAHSRWVAKRNLGVSGFQAYAAVWHSAIPAASLTMVPGSSPSLQALNIAHASGQGLLLRYCTYLLAPLVPMQQLAADFANGVHTINPAIGRVLGTVGIWRPNSMKSLAQGRRLSAGPDIILNRMTVSFNPATVQVDSNAHRISVDLINTVPEVDARLEKVDVGQLDLTLRYQSGNTTLSSVIGTIPNTRVDYENRAGLVDFDVPANVWPFLADGQLQVVQRSTGNALLDETPSVFETDDRAVYVQQGQSGTITLHGWLKGQPAAAHRVQVRQVATANKTFTQVPPAAKIVNCPDFVDLGSDGTAVMTFQGMSPGFCTLFFSDSTNTSADDFFACIRVLPRDDFSAVPDSQLDFDLIYREVLQYYHLLHPGMDERFDLSNRALVEAKADKIRERLRAAWEDHSYMPRTRDLSAGKAALLLRWCDLISPPSNG